MTDELGSGRGAKDPLSVSECRQLGMSQTRPPYSDPTADDWTAPGTTPRRTQTGWTFRDFACPHSQMERGDWARFNRAMDNKDFDEVELPIRSLNATQKTVNPDFASVTGGGELPVVLKKNGQYYVQDGHHRITAIADSGRQTARVRLVDLDPPSADPRQMELLSESQAAAPASGSGQGEWPNLIQPGRGCRAGAQRDVCGDADASHDAVSDHEEPDLTSGLGAPAA